MYQNETDAVLKEKSLFCTGAHLWMVDIFSLMQKHVQMHSAKQKWARNFFVSPQSAYLQILGLIRNRKFANF